MRLLAAMVLAFVAFSAAEDNTVIDDTTVCKWSWWHGGCTPKSDCMYKWKPRKWNLGVCIPRESKKECSETRSSSSAAEVSTEAASTEEAPDATSDAEAVSQAESVPHATIEAEEATQVQVATEATEVSAVPISNGDSTAEGASESEGRTEAETAPTAETAPEAETHEGEAELVVEAEEGLNEA